ncbi:mannose-1-phosphate guanylyltransferase, partial [Candidatus Omnitrophota bacterium]
FLLKLNGKRSLLQDTLARARKLVRLSNIIVVTNKEHLKHIKREIPGLSSRNIIAEPVSRNTAACVCLAASLVRKRDPKGVICIMPADHIIDNANLKEIFNFSYLLASMKESIITLGIKPTYPATGYGYIKAGKFCKRLISKGRSDAYKVAKFVEKPTAAKAKSYIKAKNYFWNSGIFVGKAQTFIDEFKRLKPGIYKVSQKIDKYLGTSKQQMALDRDFKKFPDISLDYAIMEKTRLAYVVRSDLRWQDVGSWLSVQDQFKKDRGDNIFQGNVLGIDIKDSIVMGEDGHLVAVLGLKGLVVVQTKDATLICPKYRAQETKKLVELLSRKRSLSKFV